MRELSTSMNVEATCSLFGYTKQSYYRSVARAEQKQMEEKILLQVIADIRLDMPRLGGRKLHSLLCQCLPSWLVPGRDALFDLLRKEGLLIGRRRIKPYTTNSHHHYHKYPNLIRDFVPCGPGQLYVSDITYVEVAAKCYYYLSLVTDAYSRKIIGWCLSDNLKAASVIQALRMALSQSKAQHGLIHHSDRGVQYCCTKYVDILLKNKVSISMTEDGDPLENAIAERVNGILKTEWINYLQFKSLPAARREIGRIIDIYNTKRPHYSIELLTPGQAHLREGLLRRKWKNYYTSNSHKCPDIDQTGGGK